MVLDESNAETKSACLIWGFSFNIASTLFSKASSKAST